MTVDGGDADAFIANGLVWDDNPTAKQMAETFAASPFRFNDDFVTMPLQCATQWDSLAHVYYDGQLYNGFPAATSPPPARSGTPSTGSGPASCRAACSSTSHARAASSGATRARARARRARGRRAAQGVRVERGDCCSSAPGT